MIDQSKLRPMDATPKDGTTMPDPGVLMEIVMKAMTKRYASHVLPQKTREEIASVIVDDLCGAMPSCAILDIDGRARNALKILLDLAATVLVMCDDSEDYDDEHSVHHLDFKKVCDLLEALDDLPDDQPECTMGPVAKARWSMRHVLTALASADDTPDPRDTILAKMAEALKLAQDAGLYFSDMESDAEMTKREAVEAKISETLAEYEAWSGAKGENEGGG